VTEILFKLGLEKEIVGVDEYSNYPEKAKDIEKVGTFDKPNVEKIILLKPGYILVNARLDADKADYLKQRCIEIIQVSPKTVEALCGDIKKIGIIFNKEREADFMVEDINNRIKNLPKRSTGEGPKVFVQLFDDPLTTVSSFIGDVIELAGGRNIADDVKEEAGIFSMEALIDRNPDIILVMGFSSVSNFPQSVNAVKNNRIYKNLNPDIFLRPGPRAIDAVEELNRIFYE
jgi:iron complex transport system substrate-binding protein